MALEGLPHDARAMVARHVRDARALGALGATCRAWRAALAADDRLWWDLCAHDFPWWAGGAYDPAVVWARRYRAWHAWRRAPSTDSCLCCGYRSVDLGESDARAILRGAEAPPAPPLAVGAGIYVRDAAGRKRVLLAARLAPLADDVELRLGADLDDAALRALVARERLEARRLGVVLVAVAGGRACAVYESDGGPAGSGLAQRRQWAFRAAEHDVVPDGHPPGVFHLDSDCSLLLGAELAGPGAPSHLRLRRMRLRLQERLWGTDGAAARDASRGGPVRALLRHLHARWATEDAARAAAPPPSSPPRGDGPAEPRADRPR